MSNIKIPEIIYIKYATSNDFYSIQTSDYVWKFWTGGYSFKIYWNRFDFTNQLETYLKLFIIHRLKNKSISTVINGDNQMLKLLNKHQLYFPFIGHEVTSFFVEIKNHVVVSTFKTFYKWCVINGFKDFEDATLSQIKEYRLPRRSPYSNVFLNQFFLQAAELDKIYSRIKTFNEHTNYQKIRDNIILSISYELAPRRSQFFLLNISDFAVVNGPSSNSKYYSINLPMSKKRKAMEIEKRHRGISKELGEKMEKLLELYPSPLLGTAPLFTSKKGQRLKVDDFTKIIKNELMELGISKTLTDMRHHLAQSLADQGSSAEIIAEILGHNSTMPARAYIAATPKIAEIKAKALGKNRKYNEIITMISTGKIIQKNQATNKERWVKGTVGNQFIGGIGSCGLPKDTSCPKNPVYACYTCLKFHPFKNGNHEEVKNGLQNQAQFHIDIAENAHDIKHNRPVTQLEETIAAVDHVLIRIKKESNGK